MYLAKRTAALLLVLAMASPAAAQTGDGDSGEPGAQAAGGGDEGAEESTPQSAEEAMQGSGMTSDRELNDARAREHFQIATRYYDEGRFVEAASQFQEAYELSGRSELLYNAYIAYREAHQNRRAAASLAAYLDETPDAPDRVNLEARLAELRRAIEAEEQQAQQLTDAERRAADEAQRAEQEAQARREAEAAPEAWPWVIAGVGAAAVIAGAVLGGLALSDATALNEECPGNACLPDSNLTDRRDTARAMAITGDFLMFGGGAVAIAGIILGLVFGLPGSTESADEDASASLACDGQGCYGLVRGSF